MVARHRLVLTWPGGREETVRVRADETVLDATDSTAIGLPFGCRTGACGTCVARLLDGTVRHERPPRALKPRHIDDGYVLCCVARPRTDARLVVGPTVQPTLVATPWR